MRSACWIIRWHNGDRRHLPADSTMKLIRDICQLKMGTNRRGSIRLDINLWISDGGRSKDPEAIDDDDVPDDKRCVSWFWVFRGPSGSSSISLQWVGVIMRHRVTMKSDAVKMVMAFICFVCCEDAVAVLKHSGDEMQLSLHPNEKWFRNIWQWFFNSSFKSNLNLNAWMRRFFKKMIENMSLSLIKTDPNQISIRNRLMSWWKEHVSGFCCSTTVRIETRSTSRRHAILSIIWPKFLFKRNYSTSCRRLRWWRIRCTRKYWVGSTSSYIQYYERHSTRRPILEQDLWTDFRALLHSIRLKPGCLEQVQHHHILASAFEVAGIEMHLWLACLTLHT